MTYYEINEDAARRAKDMNSYFGYTEGSATASYRRYVDEAAELAERCKKSVDPMYHEQIDALLDHFAKRLADNLNNANAIDARVPSVMIAGPANFPVRAKEKQNAARDKNMQEYQETRAMLDKMRGIGHGGIQSDDPKAVEKIREKICVAEVMQEHMKIVNAYYRKHKTLEGCDALNDKEIRDLTASMARDWRADPVPFESYELTNNNANIRRMKERLATLEKAKNTETKEQDVKGIRVVENTDAMRLQLFFPGKPDEATRSILKSNGFLWAPSVGAWQRQLTSNGRYACKQVLAKIGEQA
jgi:hypothetical protein